MHLLKMGFKINEFEFVMMCHQQLIVRSPIVCLSGSGVLTGYIPGMGSGGGGIRWGARLRQEEGWGCGVTVLVWTSWPRYGYFVYSLHHLYTQFNVRNQLSMGLWCVCVCMRMEGVCL